MQGEQFFDYRIRLAKVLEYADADLAFMPYDDVKAGGGVKQAFLQAIGLGGLDLEDPVSDTIHDSIDNRLTNLFALINNNIRLDKKQRTLLTRILSSADLGKERSSLLDWDTRLAIRDRYIDSNRQLAASHFSMDSPRFNFEKDFVPIAETTQYWSIEKTAAYLESFKRAETGED